MYYNGIIYICRLTLYSEQIIFILPMFSMRWIPKVQIQIFWPKLMRPYILAWQLLTQKLFGYVKFEPKNSEINYLMIYKNRLCKLGFLGVHFGTTIEFKHF